MSVSIFASTLPYGGTMVKAGFGGCSPRSGFVEISRSTVSIFISPVDSAPVTTAPRALFQW